MSSIPEQEYMCDGIAENIITDLARFRDLTVIARNSSFAYRGKAVRAQEIRHDLGADFILEGSVQRAGERVRVTAQLIDGASGRQVWAERYDRTVDDLFAVMDDVTQIIVGTLGTTYGGRLRKAAGENVIGAGTGRFRAFVSFLRGMEAFNRFTRDSIATAIGSLSEALALDPRYAKAQAKLAWAHIADIYLGFSEREDESWAAAHRAAVAALAADDDEAWGHWAIAGCALFHDRQFDRCIAEMRRALELNPNDADVLTDMGLFLAYAGEADEGLAYAQHALRINPHRPDYNVAQLAQIQHDARRYQEALVSIDSIRGMNTALMQVYAASSHAALGQTAAAGAAVARLLAGEPKSSVAYWTGPERAPYRRDEDRAHLAANLKAAGLRD
jgi:adenylate cyclase